MEIKKGGEVKVLALPKPLEVTKSHPNCFNF